MNRRKFLKASATGALVSPNVLAEIRNESSYSASPEPDTKPVKSVSVSTVFAEQDQRQRLLNVALCEKAIQSCMRKQLVINYLPGQCTYNLGEYPCRTPWKITEYDVQQLDKLKANGIQLIQLHENGMTRSASTEQRNLLH